MKKKDKIEAILNNLFLAPSIREMQDNYTNMKNVGNDKSFTDSQRNVMNILSELHKIEIYLYKAMTEYDFEDKDKKIIINYLQQLYFLVEDLKKGDVK